MKTAAQKKSFYSVKGNAKGIVKDVDTTGRVVTGFFNTFNFYDSDGDILLPGCSKRSISQRGPNSKAVAKIKHALHHDLTQLPGKIQLLEERDMDGMKGIYFETKMADTTIGNDTLKNYQEKIYDNHSIGFQYLDGEFIDREAKNWAKVMETCVNPEEMDKHGYCYLIKEIALFEGSTVAFGANKLTPFLGIKSGDKEDVKAALFEKMDKLNSALKSGTQSDDMMHTFELMLLQIKQMIDELSDGFEITIEKPVKKEVKKEIDYLALADSFKM